jgi:hypothetical protein
MAEKGLGQRRHGHLKHAADGFVFARRDFHATN